MERPDKKNSLIDLLKEIEGWSLEDKTKFFEKVGERVPIGMRQIFERTEITETQKIEALRLLNEFHHRMNQLKNDINLTVGEKFKIDKIYDYVKQMYNQNEQLISAEIAYCLQGAFEIMNLLSVRKNEYAHLEPSIYRLFEDEKFDKNIAGIIGAENLHNLEGFILGYFYAIDSNEISMHGTRVYPNLKKIEDWIMEGKSVQNWKQKSDINSVKEFLKRYRDEIIELD